MAITIDLSPALTDRLKSVEDVNEFVETAIHREFNRQRAVTKIHDLAQMISCRSQSQALSEEELVQLVNEL